MLRRARRQLHRLCALLDFLDFLHYSKKDLKQFHLQRREYQMTSCLFAPHHSRQQVIHWRLRLVHRPSYTVRVGRLDFLPEARQDRWTEVKQKMRDKDHLVQTILVDTDWKLRDPTVRLTGTWAGIPASRKQ